MEHPYGTIASPIGWGDDPTTTLNRIGPFPKGSHAVIFGRQNGDRQSMGLLQGVESSLNRNRANITVDGVYNSPGMWMDSSGDYHVHGVERWLAERDGTSPAPRAHAIMNRLHSRRRDEESDVRPVMSKSAEGTLTAWLLVSCIVLVGSLLLGGAGWWGYEAWRWRTFSAERRAIEDLIESWQASGASGVDPHVWHEVNITLHNAVGNVCFSPNHVSIDEMRRLRAEVEAKSRDPITLESLDWLWWRLGRTGPHGAKYSAQMRPLWDEARATLLDSTDGPSK